VLIDALCKFFNMLLVFVLLTPEKKKLELFFLAFFF
jgi:hypothetical protein